MCPDLILAQCAHTTDTFKALFEWSGAAVQWRDWTIHCQSALSLAFSIAICYFSITAGLSLHSRMVRPSFTYAWLKAFSRIIKGRVAQPLLLESGPSPLLQQSSFLPQSLMCSCSAAPYSHHSRPRCAISSENRLPPRAFHSFTTHQSPEQFWRVTSALP